MEIPTEINQPERPSDKEQFHYVSARSYDPEGAICIGSLFRAFTRKYNGPDPLLAFFEWILIQLAESPSKKDPFIFSVGVTVDEE